VRKSERKSGSRGVGRDFIEALEIQRKSLGAAMQKNGPSISRNASSRDAILQINAEQ